MIILACKERVASIKFSIFGLCNFAHFPIKYYSEILQGFNHKAILLWFPILPLDRYKGANFSTAAG